MSEFIDIEQLETVVGGDNRESRRSKIYCDTCKHVLAECTGIDELRTKYLSIYLEPCPYCCAKYELRIDFIDPPSQD